MHTRLYGGLVKLIPKAKAIVTLRLLCSGTPQWLEESALLMMPFVPTSQELALSESSTSDLALGQLMVLLQYSWPKEMETLSALLATIHKRGSFSYSKSFNYITSTVCMGCDVFTSQKWFYSFINFLGDFLFVLCVVWCVTCVIWCVCVMCVVWCVVWYSCGDARGDALPHQPT